MVAAAGPPEHPPAASELRAATGALGERAAAEHLRRRDLEVIERNHRNAAGEIDLIARGPDAIVFVEVKTTRCARPEDRGEALAGALERVPGAQRARIRRAAAEWLRSRPARPRQSRDVRFDAIAVVLDPRGRLVALDHVEDAF